jgi:hypothetical protein
MTGTIHYLNKSNICKRFVEVIQHCEAGSSKRWIGAIRGERFPAFIAGLLIPTETLSAFTLPSVCLLREPFVYVRFLQNFQLSQDIPMVKPTIALKCLDPSAGEFCTQAAVQKSFSIIG